MLAGRSFDIRTRRPFPEWQVRKREREYAKLIMMRPVPMGRTRTTVALSSEVIDPLFKRDLAAMLGRPLGEP